ncbi:MAG: nickel pincer cofactor biosynthesis protein LarC, partial [Actinomycetia bacterium]|nr:nickel pincer cofactor biosynthesis protein LarC [Actinomycetes bacterium]
MEKILYLDCFSGISGDMMIGALLDAGLDIGYLSGELDKLGLKGYRLKKSNVTAGVISAVRFDVEITGKQIERNYTDIRALIMGSSLAEEVKRTSLDVFESIAAAEAKIHGRDVADVNFHEVGAVDSIIDIVGTVIGLHKLEIKKVFSGPVPLGSGSIDTSHGKLPVPAPATLEILKGVSVYTGDFDFEVTTPTGAGIIRTLARGFEGIMDMEIESIGYGAGSKSISGHSHSYSSALPNVLRIVMGNQVKKEEKIKKGHSCDTVMLSTNIDDSSPEVLGYAMEKLHEQKAVRDAWLEHIYMKKNRPAFKLSVICDLKEEAAMVHIIFKETSTIGIRREEISRYCLERKIEKIKLPYGEVEIKTARFDGKEINSSPEY